MPEVFDDKLTIQDSSSGNKAIVLRGDGVVVIRRSDGTTSLRIGGQNSNVTIGGNGTDADLALHRKDAIPGQDSPSIRFNADRGAIVISNASGEVVARLSDAGHLRLGGDGAGGRIDVRRSNGSRILLLDGENGNLFLGGNGADGDISLFPSSAVGDLGAKDQPSIHLDADAGDIRLTNADAAEEFDFSESDVEPGDVVVIDDEGCLAVAAQAYDRRVAGVVSGAGALRPALVLNRRQGYDRRHPVSLNGTAFCKVDSAYGAIAVGDLLTTSQTPGHAMRASDPARAFGAVIGKALKPLDEGRGLVHMLVSLQ